MHENVLSSDLSLHSLTASAFANLHCCLVPKSCLTLCNVWTVAHQAPLSLGCPRQVGCHFLLQGIFLTQRSNPHLVSCIAGRFFTTELPGEANLCTSQQFHVQALQAIHSIFPFSCIFGYTCHNLLSHRREPYKTIWVSVSDISFLPTWYGVKRPQWWVHTTATLLCCIS